jgi:hypothetical protein
MFDKGDTAAGDWAAGMSVQPTKPNPMSSAVRAVTILFITVFPFGRHDMQHPNLIGYSDRAIAVADRDVAYDCADY